MKVAVSATEKDLEAVLDPLFGRCAFFIIVDTDSMSFEAFDVENENQIYDDLGPHSKDKPWYGYVRLQQETPHESKGDK